MAPPEPTGSVLHEFKVKPSETWFEMEDGWLWNVFQVVDGGDLKEKPT